MRVFVLIIAVCLLHISPAKAQSILLENANVFTGGPNADLGSGSILIDNGKIVKIGRRIDAPKETVVFNLKGATVTPGLVVASTTLGSVEINSRAKANDSAPSSDVLSAGADMQYAINPRSSLLPIARSGGVTRAVITPRGGGNDEGMIKFGGQPALILTANQSQVLVNARLGVTLALNDAGVSRASLYPQLKMVIDDAKLYAKRKSSFTNEKLSRRDWALADLDALSLVVTKKKPLIVSVDRASDISTIIKFARTENIELILIGVAEGWMVADEIASANIPVILNPTDNLPNNFDKLGATHENAARLTENGVKVSIIGPSAGHDARLLRFHAGIAAANGLSRQEALEAITVNPARAWGESSFGELSVGQDADIAVWSGDPFEPLTVLQSLYIRGEKQTLDNRQKALVEKYFVTPIRANNE
jgi:imidazolonepropionase-like amidohydrolase